jgi:predicted transcriptional regulator
MFHEPEKVPEVSAETQNLFDQGHVVGEFAKKLFPGGIEVSQETFKENLRFSKELLSKRKPLFEVGFLTDKIFARADVLEPAGKGEWDIVEVKSSTSVKEEHVHDVAFQRFCYESAGLKIRKCFLMHINSEYVRHGEIDPKKLFVKEDITELVDETTEGLQDRISILLKIISSKTPPGHCSHPATCPMPDECWGFLPKNSVFSLYYGGKKCLELYNSGILAIKDLPSYVKLTACQQIQLKCEITKKIHVNKDEIKKFLSGKKYPLYFLDFETYSLPIPLFDGVRPYQRIPFQFSLHLQKNETSKPEHHCFLAEGSGDPREKLMKELKKAIGDKGSIISFNATFEKGVLKELAEKFPEHKKWVESILPRFIDLLVPFRNFHYYHPDQGGCASIKKVLPAMTGRSYEDMEIGAGGDASALFLAITLGKMTKEQIKKTRDDLEKYCSLDTEAMVLIMKELEKLKEPLRTLKAYQR